MIKHNFPSGRELVEQYVKDVRAGTPRAVGELERAGLERYLADRETGHERGWMFDEKLADKYVSVLPLMIQHTTAEWAGEPFIPSPWQAFVFWNLFGWRSIDTKLRRFRKAYITVARKNGKTFVCAALCILCAFCDSPFEPRGECYVAATKESQAALTWNEARRMIEANPELGRYAKVYTSNNVIMFPKKPWRETIIRPVGADGKRQDGLNPHLVVKDEYHAWNHTLRDLDEKLSTGGASRRQALEAIITTAGDEDSHLWIELDDFAARTVRAGAEGTALDDTLFCYIARGDIDADPYEQIAQEQANPNIDVSVSRKYLADQAADARRLPSKRRPYLRYHINRLTASFEQAFPEELWTLGNQTFDLRDGDDCFAAFDLGRSNDWAAVAAVFPQFSDGAWRFAVRARSWAAAGNNPSIDYRQPPFSEWIKSGQLGFQNREVLDFEDLELYLKELHERYNVREVAYDKTFAGDFAARIEKDHGFTMFEFFQTYKRYTAPLMQLERDLKAGRIAHQGDLVLAWQAGNAQTVENKQGQKMLDKGEGARRKKIDAVVALVMAYGEARYHLQQDTGVGYVCIP